MLVRPNELKEKWDGKRLRRKEANGHFRHPNHRLAGQPGCMLQPWIHLADNIYLDSKENDRKASLIQTSDYRFISEMKSRYPLHQLHSAQLRY